MSVSPQPSATIVSPMNTLRSPPNSAITNTDASPTTIGGQSNARLAELLSTCYRDIDALRAELRNARRRAEAAENILNALGSGSGSLNSQQQQPLPEAAIRTLRDYEQRVQQAEVARDEAEARRRVLSENWEEMNRFLNLVEARAADARAGFARIVTEGGGQLVLPDIPIPGQHHHHQLNHPNQGLTIMPPPSNTRHRGHSYSRSAINQPTQPWPTLQPSPHGQSRVRPRSGSMDGSYMAGAPGQPPAKRSRNERERDREGDRAQEQRLYGEPRKSHSRDDADFYRAPGARPSRSMDGEHSRQPPQLHRPPRQRSRSSRSPSQDSADIDELIIEATTDDVERRLTRSPRQIMTHVHRGHPEMYSNMGYRPDSPIDYRSYPHHSHPRGGVPHLDSPSGGPPGVSVMSGPAMHPDASGPLERPGQVQTYQTHIFAPPVTGAPVKKTGPNGSVIVSAPTPAVSSGSYPPTNAQGQRICRSCGQPGRYKDGKCVEKWGPGPEGPGTVCDRCRKKMKRVERRGTLESQQASQSGSLTSLASQPTHTYQPGIPTSLSDRSIHRSDTMPVNNRPGSGLGPSGTHLISPHSSFPHTERYRDESHLSRPPSTQSHIDKTPREIRSPPTPPAIATLSGSGDDAAAETKKSHGRNNNGEHYVSARHDSGDLLRPSPANGHSRRAASSGDSASGKTPVRSPPISDKSGKIEPKPTPPPPPPASATSAPPTANDADVDADADADGDAEADVDDAELELLEAVDAAEANSSGSAESRPNKAEDDEEMNDQA